MTQTPRWRAALAVVLLLLLTSFLCGQSTNATISGRIADPTNARIPQAGVVAVAAATNARYETTSDASGEYHLTSVPPGRYTLEVEKSGFKKAVRPDVVVHVQDALEINFELPVGATSESITVEGKAPLLNVADATVSTLIENRFVENMPLNGRSFSSLLDLTPGVVLTPSNFQEQGQFSVNGQRPDANYFMVDGVAANLGTSAGPLGQGGAGQLPATSAFGGMSNLVTLDALQEFRIQTSTFAPEFGRMPGAQVSVATKSGTNKFRGTAFEYLRNDFFDANNWFANNKGLPEPPLRQNDFGGVLGGPIVKDKLFFFDSYEGLRLRQPQVANTFVPTVATRQNAPAAVQPLLNAFPLPNGPDAGNGTAAFAAGYSDPSSLDSYGIRADYLISQRVTVFGRYSDAPSSLEQRAGGNSTQDNYNAVSHNEYRTQSATVGSTQTLTARLINEARFNYSRSRAHTFFTLDNFGGGVPPDNSTLFPSFASPQTASVAIFGNLNPFGLRYRVGEVGNNLEQQFNFVDIASRIVGPHQLKFGMDYRHLRPELHAVSYQLQYLFSSLANLVGNKVPLGVVISRTPSTLIFENWSFFAQDTWKATRSVTVTYGLRWEYNPAPSSPDGTLPFTVNQVNDFSSMTLAPQGTQLWDAQKDDFAPRLGVAWQPFAATVLRAGAGIFYDVGYSQVANGSSSFPFGQQQIVVGTSFPLTPANAAPPVFRTTPPVSLLVVVDPKHVLPRTYEWNAAAEQSLGKSDVVTLTYLGAAGRKLMRRDVFSAPNPNFSGEFDVLSNGGTSSYNSLQAQYRRRLSHGLQTLASYTWAHSIDDISTDGNFQNAPLSKSSAAVERGNSDFDIRHTFSAAISYDVPAPPSNRLLKQVFGDWSTDTIIYVRSAPPVNVVTGKNPFGPTSPVLTGANSAQRPNVVAGVPFYLDAPGQPCGRMINAGAFTTPASGQGDLGRNALRGCNAAQLDMTLRRRFRLTEQLGLQMRADFFNIFNHPNFGNPVNFLSSPQFGKPTQMLNTSLGSGGQNGGMNPLYQIGGPRSIQLAAKLQF